ncbi:MAG: flagellar basal body rod protein FlgC [Ruminococcaceae bacterium]|jgi:flagellar basal-body rod protein FlgC|nr:flagellar basal body rod protein FlgC [Oscillospiraceae bacterium]
MAFFSSMNIVGSGMTAQQARLDVISENITNLNTTRTEGGGAYRRKITVMQAETGKNGFREAMSRAARRGRTVSNRGYEQAGGVKIVEIAEDQSELPMVYDPTHPDANEEGYVQLPNVTLVAEVTDAMAASQAFSANVTAFNALKQVMQRGLDIGV